jgi:hypothetical protein
MPKRHFTLSATDIKDRFAGIRSMSFRRRAGPHGRNVN